MINVVPNTGKLIPVSSPLGAADRRSLVALETLTILFLVALTFWSVGPLIEEWGLFRAFNENGLGYLQTFAPSIPMRPLHLTAYALQWLLGAGQPIGVALGTALLMVIRYFVTRWAFTPLLVGYDRWVISVLAATLVFWPGVWLGRYGSAQLSAILFIVAVGCSIRLHRQWSIKCFLGGAISVSLMLAMYQGLTLCLVFIPLISLLWKAGDADGSKYSHIIPTVRVSFALGIGFVLYCIYWLIVSNKVGSSGYEGALAADSTRLLTVNGLLTHIKAAFYTAYGKQVQLLALLLAIALLICSKSVEKLDSPIARLFAIMQIFALVAILPIVSLIYVNVLHIGDVDRVLFPVSAGFVMVCASLLAHRRQAGVSSLDLFSASLVISIVIASSLLVAHESRQYVQLQRSVIAQTWSALDKGSWNSVMIHDTTGSLGDVYTFLGPTLGDASTVLGRRIVASICTPLSVDRLHYVARRFPIATTPNCEDLPSTTDAVLHLTARTVEGAIVVDP